MNEKILAIIFSLLIFAQASLVRKLVGTWIFPACLFGLFWFALTFIPLVVLFNVPIEPMAMAYILSCCLAVSATALITDWKKAYEFNRKLTSRANLGSSFIRFSFYGATTFTLFSLVINTAAQGFSFDDIVFDILNTSASYIDKRYNDSLDVNIFGRLSVVFTYTAAIIGGMYYSDRPPHSRGFFIILSVLMPSAAVMVIQGAKGTLFLALAYFFSGILIDKIKKNDLTLIKKKHILTLSIYIIFILPILTLSFLSRGLHESNDIDFILIELKKGFLSYSSSHLYAFSDWFSHLISNVSAINYTDDFDEYGFHTFMSIFKILGNDKYVPPGYYNEYYYYGDIIQSNIYTIFRGLIYDFGLLGSLFFMIGMGLFMHISFFQLLISRRPVIASSIFAHFIGYIYTTFLISQFVWNSMYATFILLITILFINDIFSKKIYLTNHSTSQ